MSTLTVTTLSDGTVSVPTNTVVNGSAKAWGAWAYPSGVPTVLDSFNVASLIDTSAGVTQVNYTSAMSNINYGSSADAVRGVANTDMAATCSEHLVGSVKGVNFEGGVATDPARFCLSVVGDLA